MFCVFAPLVALIHTAVVKLLVSDPIVLVVPVVIWLNTGAIATPFEVETVKAPVEVSSVPSPPTVKPPKEPELLY
jgi:hypothetical protein